MMNVSHRALALLLGLAFAGSSVAQESPAAGRNDRFPAIEALNASYQQKLHDLDCRRIADLAALAEKAPGPEADAAYRQLLGLAIAQNLCTDAMPAAERCRTSPESSRDAIALAQLVQMIGRAQKGEHDRALADLKVLFHHSASGGQGARPPDPDLALSVSEAFLQRLIHDSRYDVARKLCDLACSREAPAILKEHFEGRMARLELLGKPAPAIVGNDVDGKPVSLAALNGKVVLIDFWATWCPPCVAAIPALDALAQKYHDRGFVILGVNVDAMHEDAGDDKMTLQLVRRFLLKHRVAWPHLLNGRGAGNFAAAYGVEHIPANFLVGRDGKVVALEQSGEMLEQAVALALGSLEKKRDQ